MNERVPATAGADAPRPDTRPLVQVAVGVIQDEAGRVLMACRPEGKPYAGWWELPGGKLEPGETVDQALGRELAEELGIQIGASQAWVYREHSYSHARVALHFRRIRRFAGQLHGREGQALAWTDPAAPDLEPMLAASVPLMRLIALPDRYAISHAQAMGVPVFLARLERALAQGLRLVQLREPQMAPAQFEALFEQGLALCRRHGARLLVNSVHSRRFWEAADGVHWRAHDLAAQPVRAFEEGGLAASAGRDGALGWQAASCHDAEQLALAGLHRVDFAVLGPVQATASHPGRAALGWQAFERLAAHSAVPVYALGGLTPADASQAWERGAHGLAMIRGAYPPATAQ